MSDNTTWSGQEKPGPNTINITCVQDNSADALIQAYQNYIKFLAEAEKNYIGLLISHGWQCPPDLIAKGDQLRGEIMNKFEQYQEKNAKSN